MEEVNKTLKTLIPLIPQHHHWKIAARNCKKFLEVLLIFQLKLVNNIYIKLIYDRIQLRNNLLEVIEYNDYQFLGPRTRPESTIECQRF